MTKANDKNGHLSPKMLSACNLIAGGSSFTETALKLKIARGTVSRWYHHCPSFGERVELQRAAAWERTVAILRSLAPRAATVMGDELNGENRLRAAIEILRLTETREHCRMVSVDMALATMNLLMSTTKVEIKKAFVALGQVEAGRQLIEQIGTEFDRITGNEDV
jgi:hypothetical protein